jgi:2-haloacid dehalogenase
VIVTFDLFSALTDSRTGGAAALGEIAAARGWTVPGLDLYDVWDRHNKALQRTAQPPTTFRELSHRALAAAYDELGLPTATLEEDFEALQESIADWPLWPDVTEGLTEVARTHRVGILSNVDDALAARTRAYALVDPDLVLTSQSLGAYKPDPRLYRAALDAAGPDLIHVPASARDTRGALEAGLRTVRLARPGHRVDPEGPAPAYEVEDARELAEVLERL